MQKFRDSDQLTATLYVQRILFYYCPSCFEKGNITWKIKPGDPLPTCWHCGAQATVDKVEESKDYS